MLEVFLITFILILISVAGLGIKLIFDKKAEFKGGSCQATASSEALSAKGISCGCGGGCEGET
jgi:hypothetical protein